MGRQDTVDIAFVDDRKCPDVCLVHTACRQQTKQSAFSSVTLSNGAAGGGGAGSRLRIFLSLSLAPA